MSLGLHLALALGSYTPGGGGAPVLSGNLLVIMPGDSTMAGVGAGVPGVGTSNVDGSRPFSIPAQCTNRLIARGVLARNDNMAGDQNNGYDNAHMNAYRSDVVIVDTVASYSGGPSFGGTVGRMTTTLGPSITLTTEACTHITIWVPQAATGAMGVTVDGVAQTNITQAALGTLTEHTFGPFADGVHTVRLHRVSGTALGPLMILPHYATDAAKYATLCVNAGARQWTTATWVEATTFAPNTPHLAMAAMLPDAITPSLGINNMRQPGFSIAQLKLDLAEMVDATLDLNPACKIIWLCPPPIQVGSEISFTNAQLRQAYVDMQADYSGSYLIDTHASLAGLAGVNPATWAALNTNGYYFDDYHPGPGVGGDGGIYRVMGYAVADTLITAFGLAA